MNLKELVAALRTRWLGALIVFMVCVLAGFAVWIVRPPEYEANVTLYVSAQNAENLTSANQGGQLSEQRTISYVELLRGPRLTAEVGRRLGLNESPDEIADRMTVTSAADTVVIVVAARDRDPGVALSFANAVGDIFPVIVSELERPLNPRAEPQVAVRVAERPVLPDRPATPALLLCLLVGAAAGVILAIGYAVVRQVADTSIRSVDALEDAIGTSNVGSIPFDESASEGVLESRNEVQSRRSEGFRQLRTNLQFANVDSVLKVVLVTSSAANEGKSATSVNLAAALAASGARVVVIEADLRRPRASEYLGLERAVGLTSVLSGRASVSAVTQRWSKVGMDVIAAGPTPPNPSELLGSLKMRSILGELRSEYDYVVIDTPPVLAVADTSTLVPFADGVLLVCRYGSTTVGQARAAAAAVRAVSGRLLGSVLTMTPTKGTGYGDGYSSYYQTIEDEAATDVTALGTNEARSRQHGGARRSVGGRGPADPVAARPQPRPRA